MSKISQANQFRWNQIISRMNLGHLYRNAAHNEQAQSRSSSKLKENNVYRPIFWLKSSLLTVALSSLVACHSSNDSAIKVSDVNHSAVKRQSIGNCWLYATASWLESLYKTENGVELNTSESYWTWWHWYDQIVNRGYIDEISTGGDWYTASDIILNHGFVLEGEFLSDEENKQMSYAQERALDMLNAELKEDGRLASRSDRTPENVRAILDEAFGSNMADAEQLAQKASSTIVGTESNGKKITLKKALASWNTISFPVVWGKNAKPSASTEQRRKEIFTRVEKALNDHAPVVISVKVDFNALDPKDGFFKLTQLAKFEGPGRQGGHMLVLEDYTVDDVPGVGHIGEGEVSDELKTKALSGKLATLKAKNSWGTDRPDRGLSDGYTSFVADYLLKPIKWVPENSDDGEGDYYSALQGFVLPPGY